MEHPRSEARIAFASILPTVAQQPLMDIPSSLGESIRRGTTVARYGRVWRMGRPSLDEGRQRVSGRIGFESPGGPTELWDDELQDFQEVPIRRGRTSPFVVDLPSMRVVFQLRGTLIKARTFTGAFQSLINHASQYFDWRVFEEIEETTWLEWQTSVQRITALRFTLVRPNPHYGNRRLLGDVIEGARAGLMKLALTADPDSLDGLDITSELVAQSIDHASERYGNYTADGVRRREDGEEQDTTWSSVRNGELLQQTVELEPEAVEVSHSALNQALDELGLSRRPEDPLPPLVPGPPTTARREQIQRVQDAHDDDEMLEVGFGEDA